MALLPLLSFLFSRRVDPHPHPCFRYEVVDGASYLHCASTHLTAFWASTGGAAARFSVNSVHPIDDAGDMKVCACHRPILPPLPGVLRHRGF